MYEGTFKNDAMTGTGTITYPNGYKWEGKFTNGVPEGKGTVQAIFAGTKKTYPAGSAKEREITISVGKDEVKCPLPPEIPVFELDF